MPEKYWFLQQKKRVIYPQININLRPHNRPIKGIINDNIQDNIKDNTKDNNVGKIKETFKYNKNICKSYVLKEFYRNNSKKYM